MAEQEGPEEVEEAGAAAEENPDLAQPLPKRRRKMKTKVDTKKIVDNKSLPGNPLHDVPMLLKGQCGLSLQVFAGNKIYIVNTGDQTVSIPVGTLLCGYGKGKFDTNTNGNFNPDCHHMYHLKTCEQMVVHNWKMQPLKDVIEEQRVRDPEVKLAYHSMSEIASKDKLSFGVKQEIEVFFAPAGSSAGEGGEPASQTSIAGLLPPTVFDGSHCAMKVWAVKWALNGLAPIRPMVFTKMQCDIPAGQALSL